MRWAQFKPSAKIKARLLCLCAAADMGYTFSDVTNVLEEEDKEFINKYTFSFFIREGLQWLLKVIAVIGALGAKIPRFISFTLDQSLIDEPSFVNDTLKKCVLEDIQKFKFNFRSFYYCVEDKETILRKRVEVKNLSDLSVDVIRSKLTVGCRVTAVSKLPVPIPLQNKITCDTQVSYDSLITFID